MVETFNKFSNKNFTVLGVSLDRPGQKNKWVDAIHADNLTWTHVSDLQFWSNAAAQLYRVKGIPQNFLVDPNGIIETRELIKKLNKEHNTTVIVSSHILNEVERMATHVGIIHKGKMLFQGPLPELQQMKTRQTVLEIETNDNIH